MPRRKQSNPQPVKLEVEDGGGGAVVCDSGCLVLESDFLLSSELEFGDSEILESGMTVFSLSVEEDDPSAPGDSFTSFLSCRGCGQILGGSPLGAGLDLGLGLGAELYCLSCEENLQHDASADSSQVGESTEADGRRRRRTRRRSSSAKPDAPGDAPGDLLLSKLYSCSLCSFTSRYSNHLKRHMRTHDGEKPFRCPACPYASAQLVNLQRHARTHTGEKPYGCPHCSYACTSLGNLRRHQRMHSQERAQRREEKRREEKRRGRRRRKSKTQTGGDLIQDSGFLQTLGGLGSPSAPLPVLLFPLCCVMCGLTLEESDLEGSKAEGEGDAGQVCRRCSLDLLSKDGRVSPVVAAASRGPRRGQRGAKLYRCPHCPFLSAYPNHLARHAHTHAEEKPHRCPHCAYTSSHLDNLKRHMRVHTGEKPYQCPSCSYACGNLANLRRHERIHSGAKPFHCGVCGYSCNQSMNLKRHMLRHSGEKPYGCGQCGYTTGHWDNYKRHQRKHGHNTDSWDKHQPIGSLGWGEEGGEGGHEHR